MGRSRGTRHDGQRNAIGTGFFQHARSLTRSGRDEALEAIDKTDFYSMFLELREGDPRARQQEFDFADDPRNQLALWEPLHARHHHGYGSYEFNHDDGHGQHWASSPRHAAAG